MKVLFSLAFLAIATIANAQPGHHKHAHKGKGNGHYKQHKSYKHDSYDDDDDYGHRHRRVVRKDYGRDYHYHVNREMNRYDFLRLSSHQRSRLQVSLNFLISNGYGPRDYESRLRRDLRDILTRDQYRTWERRAYNNSNVFVFNFG